MAGKRKRQDDTQPVTQPESHFEPEEMEAESGYVAEALSGKAGASRESAPESWSARTGGKKPAQRSVREMSDDDIAAELAREERRAERSWNR